jgi:D-arabinitol dehydrogenase (NADP+)
MRAIVYDSPGSFHIVELPKVQLAPDEIRIRVEMAGICGTDLHFHQGDSHATFPITPGHEVVGVVEEVGSHVRSLKPGQRVVPNGNSSCGACDECLRGRPLFCLEFAALGATLPGGFAETMIAPEAKCFQADDLPLETAVLVEPTACAVHGMDVLDLSFGSDVLILGAGPTALLLGQVLLHGGAARLTIAAPTPFKLDRARSFGFDAAILIPRDDQRTALALLREFAPQGFDVVVDATGAAAVSEITLPLLRNGGTALWYGMAQGDSAVSVSPYEVFRRELTIKGSFAQIDSFPRALQLLRSGRVKTEGIVTHYFSLDEFGLALDAVQTDPSVLKAVIVN